MDDKPKKSAAEVPERQTIDQMQNEEDSVSIKLDDIASSKRVESTGTYNCFHYYIWNNSNHTMKSNLILIFSSELNCFKAKIETKLKTKESIITQAL